MVGNENSKNTWQFHMNPDAPLGCFIDFLCGKAKQGRSTWTFKLILTVYEKEAREYLGNELYEKYLEKHSKSIIEQNEEKKKPKLEKAQPEGEEESTQQKPKEPTFEELVAQECNRLTPRDKIVTPEEASTIRQQAERNVKARMVDPEAEQNEFDTSESEGEEIG